jgi:AraC-like DNA-binding protein
MTTYIRAVTLWGFDTLVESHGGDPRALLVEAGLPEDVFDEPDTLISFNACALLIEIAAHRLNRPSLGLEWTMSLPPQFPNLGGLVLCAYLAPTVRDWVRLGLEYWAYHTNGFRAEPVDDGVSPYFSLRSHMNPHMMFPVRQFVEHGLANQVQMCRIVSGHTHENPILVRFQHYKPKDTSMHEAIFRCPIEFDAPYNEVISERRFLDYPANGNLALFKPLVSFYVRQRIRRMPVFDQRASTAVSLAIPAVIGTGKCNIDFIAESLGMNTKKLQRMLSGEGTTFSEVLETTRFAMARRYLLESNAKVSEIAGLLEYAGIPPFNLAFKRWTGTTPLAFRKEERRRLENETRGGDQRER